MTIFCKNITINENALDYDKNSASLTHEKGDIFSDPPPLSAYFPSFFSRKKLGKTKHGFPCFSLTSGCGRKRVIFRVFDSLRALVVNLEISEFSIVPCA